jgi:hypothetical protein
MLMQMKMAASGAVIILMLSQLIMLPVALAQFTESPIPPSQGQVEQAPESDYNPDSESTPIQILPPWLWPSTGSQLPGSTPAQGSKPSLQPAEPARQVNPVLPKVFSGCWQGQVDQLDWIKRIPGAHKVGFWTPKTYRLCYRRVGGGPFQLTFSEAGIRPSERIIHPIGTVVPISTDGRAYAKMHATLHFDERSVDRYSRSATFAVDESTNLDCRIKQNTMAVTADVYGTRNGAPWFRARWHADFAQVPD